MTFVNERHQMQTNHFRANNIFSGLFYARGLMRGDCNAVLEHEGQNLLIFIWAVQTKNQNLRLVARSLDPEAVAPKESELIEFCDRLTYARGLAFVEGRRLTSR